MTRPRPATKSPEKPGSTSGAEKPSKPVATAKQRADLARLKHTMHAALVGEMRGWDAYWEAVGEILARKLFLLDDADTAASWLRANVDAPLRTALRNTRVAASASPDEEALYTPTKIDLALSLLDAQAAAEARRKGVPWEPPEGPRKVDFAALRYEVQREGKARRLTLAQVTAPELLALLRGVSRKGHVARVRTGPTAQALVAALAEVPGLETLSVSEHDAMVTLGAFRADQAHLLGRVLLDLQVASPGASEQPARKPAKPARKPAKPARKRA